MKCPDCEKKIRPVGSLGGTIHTNDIRGNYIWGTCECPGREWKDYDPFRNEWVRQD